MAIPAGENFIGVLGGITEPISANTVRPNDTSPYIANDTISDSTNPMTFTGIGRANGKTGYITGAKLITNQSTNTARLRLHLYKTAPSVITDNAPFTLLWSNRESRVGHIDFDACMTEGSGSDIAYSITTSLRLAFNCDMTDINLYGLLETRDAFTPAANQNFVIELTTEQS